MLKLVITALGATFVCSCLTIAAEKEIIRPREPNQAALLAREFWSTELSTSPAKEVKTERERFPPISKMK